MAEGHLVLRWARRLRSLIGKPFVSAQLPEQYAHRVPGLVGQHISSVTTHGKHLLLRLSGGETIHCHAMMSGSWQIGKPNMTLRKPADQVRLRIRTQYSEAVFFNGPVVELLKPEELAAHPRLTALGPDLLWPGFDRDEVWRRLCRAPDREIADAILDQTNVAGIGNIYKNEGLFLAGIYPRAPVGALPRTDIERLWDTLVPLMRKGSQSYRIRTRPRSGEGTDQRYWVYRRRGQQCFRCRAKITRIVHGKPQRSTYFCPSCQPELPFHLI